MRVTICVDVNDENERASVASWFARWEGRLAYKSENEGCGCCVDLWNVDGPADAIAELPDSVRASSVYSDSVTRSEISDQELPAMWRSAENAAGHLEQELARELSGGHELFGRQARAFLRRSDRDDVLFEIDGGKALAQVHLTWSGRAEVPPFPSTQVFLSRAAWLEHARRQVEE